MKKVLYVCERCGAETEPHKDFNNLLPTGWGTLQLRLFISGSFTNEDKELSFCPKCLSETPNIMHDNAEREVNNILAESAIKNKEIDKQKKTTNYSFIIIMGLLGLLSGTILVLAAFH